jgi:hypothetical protein
LVWEVVGISKKSSKRARRRETELRNRRASEAQKKKRHRDRTADAPPASPQVREPFYLWQLGLKKACFDDWSVSREHPPVIRREGNAKADV